MAAFRKLVCLSALAAPVLLMATEPASAQIIYRQWSYYGSPYARPPAIIRPVPLPPGEIIDILADSYGYRRIGQPQFAGHMYVVGGVDRHGRVVRSYVDAFSGRLIDIDVLQPAARQAGPGPRIARLPEPAERPAAAPTPPRRTPEVRPLVRGAPSATPPDTRPPRREASRPPAATPDAALPTTTTRPSASPVVPLTREPRVVNPAEVRLPDEADKAPPMARPAQPSPAPALVAPVPQSAAPAPSVPRAAAPQAAPQPAPQAGPARPAAPGASQVAPAPLDDAVRRPGTPAGPPVPVAPLF